MSSRYAQFRVRDFEFALRTAGKLPLAWYRRVGPCPRSHNDATSEFSPDPSCPLCGGVGVIFEPMPLPESRGSRTRGRLIFTDAKMSQRRIPWKAEAGDMLCVFLETDYPISEGDIVIPPSREERDGQVLVRALDDPATERLPCWPVTRIERIYSGAGTGRMITQGFEVSADGRGVTWTDLTQVPAGEQYTICYWYRPAYAVLGGTVQRMETATDGSLFPTSCGLRFWRWQHTDLMAAAAIPVASA